MNSSHTSQEEAVQDDPMAAIRAKIMAIQRDTTLSDEEKARKRQELMMGTWAKPVEEEQPVKGAKGKAAAKTKEPATNEVSLDENLKCGVCLNLCERPVTAPCQHNFCLACFKKWVAQGKTTCPTCRHGFPSKFAQNVRINTALVTAIRLARNPIRIDTVAQAREYRRIDNESRPDQAFTTDKAVRAGRANAASGKIFVTTPNDHFGPIGPEYDPTRKLGVVVGEWWKDRLDCRQWGAHFPHVAGIAGQSNIGAQSVVLSGGYEDDRDEGEWFLYTGSGGRDLSGNKRTNKVQSFDQEFENMNKALKLSCINGLPVRVVRSYKEKRSAYAPTEETPVRYDGVYRILRCWRKPGNQKHLICRYLFVRCDNSPAPWITDSDKGDDVRLEIPAEATAEIAEAKGQVFCMSDTPYWDWLEDQQCWGWAKPAPASRSVPGNRKPANPGAKVRKQLSETEKALKDFRCALCKDTLKDPLSTPCGHNFCKSCLDKKFEGITEIAVNAASSRSLRVRRNLKPCPTCKADICEFMATARPNREMMAVISKLQEAVHRAKAEAERIEKEKAAGGEDGAKSDEEVDEAEEDGEEGAGQAEQEDDEMVEEDGAGPSNQTDADEAGPSKQTDADEAGPSGAAHDGMGEPPAASTSPGPAAPAAAPVPAAVPYAKELETLTAEFPHIERSLIECFLADQGGDMYDVRQMLKRVGKPAAAKAKKADAKASKKRKAESDPVPSPQS